MAKSTVVVKFLADVDGMKRGVDQVNTQLSTFSKSMKVLAGIGAATFAAQPILDFGKAAVIAASNFDEMANKVSVVFGDGGQQIQVFAENAASALGLSKTAALDAASQFGVFGKAAGLIGTDLAGFSTNLTTLAADMASFNNADISETIAAIGAGLRGESEPLRRFGVLLDDATLKAEAMSLGVYNGTGALTQQQRVLAANSAIWKQTNDQQGDFARTQDGLANSSRVLSAQFENLKLALGQGLLRGFGDTTRATDDLSSALEDVTPLAEFFGEAVGDLAGHLVTIAGTIGRVVGPIGDLAESLSGGAVGAADLAYGLNPLYWLTKGLAKASEGLNTAIDGITGAHSEQAAQIAVVSARYNGMAAAAARAAVAARAAAQQAAIARANAAVTDRYTAQALAAGKSISFTGGNLTEYFNELNRAQDSIVSGGSSGSGSKAATEKFKTDWAAANTSLKDSLDGMTVTILGKNKEINEKMAGLLKDQTARFEDTIRAQQKVIEDGYKAIADYSNSVVKSFTGFSLSDFIQTNEDGSTNFLADKFDQWLKDKTAIANSLAPLATVLPEALTQQLLNADPAGAKAVIDYFTNNPAQGPLLTENLQALADTTQTLLGGPMALAFATVGGESAVELIAAAKQKIDDESDRFQKWVQKKLKTRITVEVEYKAVNSVPGVQGDGAALVSALRDYERVNGTAWRL